MIIYFKSVVDDEITEFQTEATIKNTEIIFKIPEENTIVRLRPYKDSLIMTRTGESSQKLLFHKGKKTSSTLEIRGFKFNLEIYTKECLCQENLIYVEYDLFQEENYLSSHKIWINITKMLEKIH